MLKTLKWVYDLGVRQERVRISAHLQLAAQGARTNRERMDFMIRDNKELKAFKEKRLKQLEFDQAVNARVEVIIQDMFQDEGHYVSGASIMFPDDGHKGKVK